MEFCRLVREILNIKKVREMSGNFIIWAKNIWVEQVFCPFFKCLKMLLLLFFSRSLCSLVNVKRYNDLLEKILPQKF